MPGKPRSVHLSDAAVVWLRNSCNNASEQKTEKRRKKFKRNMIFTSHSKQLINSLSLHWDSYSYELQSLNL